MKYVAFIVLILLCGCTTVRIESLSLLQSQDQAMAFWSRDQERTGKSVSVVGLPEILARATWVDQRLYHKGGIWLRFSGGREVFLPTGFEFFLVGDVRGHFEVRKQDVERYREIVQRIKKEADR